MQTQFLSKKSPEEIERFNNDRMHRHPDPGSQWGGVLRRACASKLPPGRKDIVTWFDVLDLDEGRPVPVATSLN